MFKAEYIVYLCIYIHICLFVRTTQHIIQNVVSNY